MEIGSVVMFTDSVNHRRFPTIFPKAGTIGYIVGMDHRGCFWIQWPSRSTSGTDRWWCDSSEIIELSHDTKTKRRL